VKFNVAWKKEQTPKIMDTNLIESLRCARVNGRRSHGDTVVTNASKCQNVITGESAAPMPLHRQMGF
jgi:hypothetical protein